MLELKKYPYRWTVVLLTVITAISGKLDIMVSSWFYTAEKGFYLKDNLFLQFIRKGLPEIILGFTALLVLVWLVSKVKKKCWFGISNKVIAFIVSSLAIATGLVVNGIFKEFWGRARPSQIEMFGGDKIFTPPVVIANQCESNCSFMSGHASLGFWVICFALLAPEKWRKTAIATAFVFGCIVSFARIAQGGHFFSEVFFAATTTIIITVYIHGRIFK